MPARKRTAAEAQLDLPIEPSVAPELQETLHTLRNMWEFASLMQYIFLFGAVVKIDEDFDIDVGINQTSPRRRNEVWKMAKSSVERKLIEDQ